MVKSPKRAQEEVTAPASPGGATFSEPEHRWTFLSNHAHVLIVLYENPRIVLRHVALRVGITERAVQRIVQDLEDGGYLEKVREGRRNHYKVILDRPLRHPVEAHRSIADLLKLGGQNP